MSRYFRLFAVGVFLTLLVLLSPRLAQAPELPPLCDVTCEPDPGSSTYASTIKARSLISNARGLSSRIASPASGGPSAASVTTLAGSESYNYAVPILSLPGRNGLDLNLALYYNSHVWTIDRGIVPATATFNADRDYPSYGFRLGFGYIEGTFPNIFGGDSFILTEPDGGKHELRHNYNNELFESFDSSYMDFNATTNILRRKDGSQWRYVQVGTIFRPDKIQDTNGNFITINYAASTFARALDISTIVDTLGRTITFNYDGNNKLISIKQGTKTYATFTWSATNEVLLRYSFAVGVLDVKDTPADGTSLSVIKACTYANGTSYNFIYGDWGIVTKIEQRAAGSPGPVRSYVAYNYPLASQGALTDHPTFTQQTVSADGINSDAWTYSVTKSDNLVSSFSITSPTVNGISTATTTNLNTNINDWRTGLVENVVVSSGGTPLRTVTNEWNQDPMGFINGNPRIFRVTSILNDTGQQSKVEFDYGSFGNVTEVREFDYGLALKLKTQTDYLHDTNSSYTNAHILDRPKEVRVRDGSDALKVKTVLLYDTTTLSPSISPVQWANPGSTRGNVTSITRYENAAAGSGPVTRTLTYDTAGNLTKADLDCCQQRQWFFTSTTQYAYPETITTGPAGGPQLTVSRSYDIVTGLVLAATDANGKTTTFTYNDPIDRLTAVTRPAPFTTPITTSYDDVSAEPKVTSTTPIDATNNLVQVITMDGLGRSKKQETKSGGGVVHSIVETQYDAVGRVKQVTNPYKSGETVNWTVDTYDALSRVNTVTPPGGQGSYSYGYAGNAVTVTDPAGKQRRTFTDALGRLTQVDEPGPRPAAGGSGTVVINGSLQSTQTSPGTPGTGWVNIVGEEQWICDPLEPPGPNCTRIWDAGTVSITVNGFVASTFYGPNSTTSSIASNLRNQLNGPSSPVTAGGTGSMITLTARTNGANTNYTLSTDSQTSQTEYFFSPSFAGDPSGPTLTGGTDPTTGVVDSGTVSITVNGLQKTVNYGQGSTGDSVASALRSAINGDSGYPVSAAGSGTTVTLTAKTTGPATNYPLSATSTTSHPETFSQPSFIPAPSGSTLTGGHDADVSLEAPLVAAYSYDVLNNLTQVSQGVQTRTFNYDSMGRLKDATTPEAGLVSYTYTNFSRVQTRTDARGVITSYTYDGLNRLKTVSYSVPAGVAATPTVTFFYDEGGAGANALGRLTRMTDGVGSETYTYDVLGRITQVARVIDATTFSTTYAYNLANELTSITYPSGRAVTQQYDLIGRLNQVSSGGTNYISSVQYNGANQPQSFNYGNGATASFGYNSHMQLSSLSYTKGATKLLELAYSYAPPNGGNNGQITGITDSTGTAEAGRSVSYTYDEWSRLSTAVTAGSASYPQWGLRWEYDRYGNRTAQVVTAGSGPSVSVAIDAATNRITGDPAVTYDAAGNMTRDGSGAIYTYDGENRIVMVTGTASGTYTYDGVGLRVKKVASNTTTRYVFSGSKVIAEYTGNKPRANSPAKEYLYAGSQLVASIAGNTTTYAHPDHLSARVFTNSSGSKVGERGHLPFGEVWYDGMTADKWKFTTYERDSETTLDYAMFRFDSTRLGRFLTPDPVGGSLLNPQSLNRYSYVRNNPINFVDPFGLECQIDGFNVPCEILSHIDMESVLGISVTGPGDPGFYSAAPPGAFLRAHPAFGGRMVNIIAIEGQVWRARTYSSDPHGEPGDLIETLTEPVLIWVVVADNGTSWWDYSAGFGSFFTRRLPNRFISPRGGYPRPTPPDINPGPTIPRGAPPTTGPLPPVDEALQKIPWSRMTNGQRVTYVAAQLARIVAALAGGAVEVMVPVMVDPCELNDPLHPLFSCPGQQI